MERRRWGPKHRDTEFLVVVMAGRKEGTMSFPQVCIQGRKDERHQEAKGSGRKGGTGGGVE